MNNATKADKGKNVCLTKSLLQKPQSDMATAAWPQLVHWLDTAALLQLVHWLDTASMDISAWLQLAWPQLARVWCHLLVLW